VSAAIPVLIYLPEDVYRALADRADVEESQVHKLITHAVTSSVRKRRNSKVTREVSEAIWHMSRAGVSDNRIAKKLGLAQATVSKHRQALGVSANFTSPNPSATQNRRTQ
jgi:DNA-binding NarL/FixJ family response regulator